MRMRNDVNNSARDNVLAALSALRAPLTASTADGRVCAAEAPLAERLEAVRSQAAAHGTPGSCPFTGWES
jgi:hypothetical protein